MLQAQLEGGEWVDLLGPGHPGIAEVKWCANRFTPFLCIAPTAASEAGKQDAEEFIEVCETPCCEGRKSLCYVSLFSTTLPIFRGMPVASVCSWYDARVCSCCLAISNCSQDVIIKEALVVQNQACG